MRQKVFASVPTQLLVNCCCDPVQERTDDVQKIMASRPDPWRASSAQGRVVVSPDLVLDAAAVRHLHDGAGAATRCWPCDHAGVVKAPRRQRLAEDSWGAREVGRLPAAREASGMPPGPSAHLALKLPLEARAVAVVVHKVDVELMHRAVPG